MDVKEKTRENLIRRRLARQGYQLVKSRRRDPDALDYGLYMVVDEKRCMVMSDGHSAFGFTLDDVEAWLDE